MRFRPHTISLREPGLIIPLCVLSMLCAIMVIARVWYSDYIHYMFLCWNLILAWVPFLLALAIYECHHKKVHRSVLIALGVLWLLFFPNAPYIVTDFLHLGWRPGGVPLWFDVALLTSFAWTGLLLGLLSLYLVQTVLNARVGEAAGWFFVVLANLLSGFGIYIGRFLRWNSWDILTSPHVLIGDVWSKIGDPFTHPSSWGVPVIFAVFLCAAYWVVVSLLQWNRREK